MKKNWGFCKTFLTWYWCLTIRSSQYLTRTYINSLGRNYRHAINAVCLCPNSCLSDDKNFAEVDIINRRNSKVASCWWNFEWFSIVFILVRKVIKQYQGKGIFRVGWQESYSFQIAWILALNPMLQTSASLLGSMGHGERVGIYCQKLALAFRKLQNNTVSGDVEGRTTTNNLVSQIKFIKLIV